MRMDEQQAVVRKRISELRDHVLDFFANVEKLIAGFKGDEEDGYHFAVRRKEPDIWPCLTDELRQQSNSLRQGVRTTMTELANIAKESLLLGETDLRRIASDAKSMAAAIKFRRFRVFDLYVHHDEDVVLGVTPSRQNEDEKYRLRMREICMLTHTTLL